MKKITLIAFIAAAMILVLGGCGSLGNMQKNHPQVRYQVSPSPLEVHGDKVIVTINGNIPPKYFNKKAVMYLQPVLQWETGEVILSPMNLKGEKVGGNGKEITKSTGGRFVYKDTVAYRKGMEGAKLFLNPVAYKSKAVNEANATWDEAMENKDAIRLGNVKITEGINSTANRVDIRGSLDVAPHRYDPRPTETMRANVYFTINMANINWNNELNKKMNTKSSFEDMKSYVVNNQIPRQIFVNAWASPEGEETYNVNLSKRRADATAALINSILDEALTERAKSENIKAGDISKYVADAKADIVITSNARGEDWDNFVKLVENSSLREKNTVINVVKSQPDKIRREQEIRNMSVVFKELEQEILPTLRRGEISFNFSGVQKTDQEIAKMAVVNPDNLTFDELMYAASLTYNYANKLQIYTSATERFGSEWSGWNNAGSMALYLGQINDAERFLETADKLSPNNPSVLNNLGLLALAKEDVDQAAVYFKQAVDAGNSQATMNEAIVEIKRGNYENAASKLEEQNCTYNLALIQLLTGNTGNAVRTLDCCIDQTPDVYYLRAVCYARLDDVPGVLENLKKACEVEPGYKYQAKNDVEFRRYRANLEFQNIINN